MNNMEPTVLAYKTLNAPFDNYMITLDGRLIRKEHYTSKLSKACKDGSRNAFDKKFTQHEVKPHQNKKSGYMQCSIRKTGHNEQINYTKYIHGLVAEAFLGPRPEGYQVDHKDGNRSNNHVSNLEYVTHRENIKRAWVRKLTKQKEI